jgi:hypothetical protein
MAYIPKPPSSSGTSTSGGTSSSSGTSSTSSSSGSSGGSSSDPYARARADAKAAEKKAAARLSAQAARLKAQAAALKLALGSKGFAAALKRELGNADLEFKEEDKLILGQYERGKTALEQQAGTTEDNRARSLGEATGNAGRERNEALQQGIENGISATDMIKAQAASLRNWAFNVGQVQTNYTDEINGLQSEHSQMVNSVVTSRQAAWREREQQRAQLYRGYYDNRGQVLTEIGNKLGEAAQYYDMANEQLSSKTYRSNAKTTSADALAQLRAAALETGKGYTELAAPTSITKWEGTAQINNSTDARQWGTQELEIKDAEGASSKLRKWEG